MIKYLALLLTAFALIGATDTPTEREARGLLKAGKADQAFSVIDQAAARNEPEAISFLAWFYDKGTSVTKDLAKAEQLYRKAALLGVPYAKWRLGVMIDQGEARTGTLEQAVELFREAAALGSSNAYVSLGVMQSRGRGTPQDFKAALVNFVLGAKLKNIHAFNEIGVIYWQGEGVTKDPVEAGAWFIVASAHNDAVATKYLGTLLESVGSDALPKMEARANEIGREFGLLEKVIEHTGETS